MAKLTVAEEACCLGIGHGAVVHWIARTAASTSRPQRLKWCVPFGDDVEAACRDRVARSAHVHTPDSTEPQASHELTVTEVAAILGISTNVVYYWIERHHVHARRAPGGRLLVTFSPEVEAACRARVATSVHLKLVPASQNDTAQQ